jgi:phytoene dehydrogenase-like protein
VESFLPGLGRSVEVMEVATPLTYQDWGNRTQGSIAGWTWAAEHAGAFGQNLLGQTPLERLLMCGIYSVTELFWGGLPTALTTGLWAAEQIIR